MQYGGDAALAVIMTAVSHLLVPIIAPVVVKLVAGSVLTVDPAAIFVRLAQLVLLPFVAAWLTRSALGAARTSALYARVGWTGGIFVIIVTWGLVADVTVVTIPLAPIATAVFGINAVLFALGHLFGAREAKTMTMVAGYRNVTLGMVLSMSVWNNPLVALPSIVFTLTQNVFAVALLFLHRRRLKRQS
jgi:BASS family bile acid:Na+ symporter